MTTALEPSTGTKTRAGRPSRASGPRFWAIEFIPQYLLGAATLFFFATKWNAVASAAESEQAVATLTAVGVGWLLFSFVVMPLLVKPQIVRVAISGAAALVLAWVLFANAYDDKNVVETLTGLEPRRPAVEPEAPAAAPLPAAPSAPVTTALPAPVRLASASLHGINHRASGTASIIRHPDGHYIVGLEDIDIEPGPDYRVYVVPGVTERTSAGAVELDKLRGNQGTQFYDVPDATNLEEGKWTVLIWCKVFAVPIATAVP